MGEKAYFGFSMKLNVRLLYSFLNVFFETNLRDLKWAHETYNYFLNGNYLY